MTTVASDDSALLQQLADALNVLPNLQGAVTVEHVPSPTDRIDALCTLRVAGCELRIAVDIVTEVYPRDALRLMWARRPFAGADTPSLVYMLAARAISPGAREALRREAVAYFDSSGSLFLSAGPLYVLIDKPPPKSVTRSIRSVFTGRRTHVLQLLLLQPSEWFNVTELAKRADVSPATASNLLQELERMDWVTTRGRGPTKERKVTHPGALLDAYAANYGGARTVRFQKYFVPGTFSDDLLSRVAAAFDAAGVGYAVSFEAAGQIYAPHLSRVSQIRCRAVGGSSLDQALQSMEARTVNDGANLWIANVKSRRDLTHTERVHDVALANPVQAYLDLITAEGRGKELAQQLRRDKLGY